ncbi:MAG: LamG-like jellyroll fold domain-containing protein, partial [Bacteroidota bacterium]
DLFSFDYAIDPVYNTPVFGNPIGRSSCPHEMGTQFVDFPQIVALNPVQYAENGEDFLFFDLAIRNLSESDDTRLYHIMFQGDDGSARVSFGDAPLSTDVIIPRTLSPGEQQIIKIKVEQNDPDVYAFEGLAFRMFPACQANLFSETYINAFFENSCPFVSMPLPNKDFVINEFSNDLIGVVMNDYILDPAIDHIKMQYLQVGSRNWMDSNIDVPGSNLILPPQQYFWDVSGIEDGAYSIRWELKCGSTLNVSPRVNGIVDRKPPRVFGSEKPSDDVYFPGDEISIMFNEIVDILDLQNGNFYVTNLSNDESVAAGISADGKTVYVDLLTNIDSFYNQSFEIGLIEVTDLYGNARTDTVKWDFIVSEPDSDRDGIGDLTDRCPGGDDCEDADMDGIPDDCDCLPTIPQNGKVISKAAMHFDGFNDHIIIPHNTTLVPRLINPTTYETWIYPKESENEHGFIAATGDFPNANHQIYFNNASNKIIVDGIDVSPLISTNTVPHNEWTHIAVVYNFNQTLLYINGVLDKVRNQALSTTDLGNNISIGNQASGNPNIWNFHGLMDEFRIWAKARTGNEIRSTMRKELEGNENLLALYFDFNEGLPFGNNLNLSVVENQSVNGFLLDNFGTLNNFEKTGTVSNWGFSPQGILNAQYDLCLTCPDTLNAAIDLDGVNDRLYMANHPNIAPTANNEMTMELWLNPADSTTGNTDVIASIAGNLNVTRTNTSIEVNTLSAVNLPVEIEVDRWTHLAIVFKTDSLEIFIDGEREYAATHMHQAVNIGNAIYLGGTQNLDHFDGRMDDIRFWNHARTAEEIKANLFQEMSGTESGLEAYYDFNEGIVNGDNKSLLAATDNTGNGNDLTFENMNLFGGYSNYTQSALNFRID